MLLSIKLIFGFFIGLLIGWFYKLFSRPKNLKLRPLSRSKFIKLEIDEKITNNVHDNNYKTETLEFHFIQEGRGPNLLLVHGLGANLLCWRPVWSRLTKEYRVTALDLPGFGFSESRPDLDYGLDAQSRRLIAFLENLEIKKTHVLASSMGCAVSFAAAIQRPDLFQRFIAISPACDKKIVSFNPKKLEAIVRLLKNYIVRPWLVRLLFCRVVTNTSLATDSIINDYYAPYHSSSDKVLTFYKSLFLIKDERWPECLNQLQAPVLLLHGAKDKVLKKSHVLEAQKHIPHVEYKEHASGGHHLMTDDPAFVVESVKKFIGKTDLKLIP